jgi:hypothetical protein
MPLDDGDEIVAKVRTALTAALMTMLLAFAWAAPAAAQEEPPEGDRCDDFGALQPICEELEPLDPALDPIFEGLEQLDPLATELTGIIQQVNEGIAEGAPCEELEPLVTGMEPLLGPLADGYEELREQAPDPSVLGPLGDTINEALDLIALVLELCAAEEPEPEPSPEPAPEEEEEEDAPPPAQPAPAPLPRTGGTAALALVGALAFGAGFAGLRGNRRRL